MDSKLTLSWDASVIAQARTSKGKIFPIVEKLTEVANISQRRMKTGGAPKKKYLESLKN